MVFIPQNVSCYADPALLEHRVGPNHRGRAPVPALDLRIGSKVDGPTMDSLSIGQVAERTGFAATTLRYRRVPRAVRPRPRDGGRARCAGRPRRTLHADIGMQ